MNRKRNRDSFLTSSSSATPSTPHSTRSSSTTNKEKPPTPSKSLPSPISKKSTTPTASSIAEPMTRRSERKMSRSSSIIDQHPAGSSLASRSDDSSSNTHNQMDIVNESKEDDTVLEDEHEKRSAPSIDEQPYAVGHCLIVRYRDNSDRVAKIIERSVVTSIPSEQQQQQQLTVSSHHKPPKKKHPNQYTVGQQQSPRVTEGIQSVITTMTSYRYYVHYFDFNRRNDEWIDEKRIIAPPSKANPLEAKYILLNPHHTTSSSSSTSSSLKKKSPSTESLDKLSSSSTAAGEKQLKDLTVSSSSSPSSASPILPVPSSSTTTGGNHTFTTISELGYDEHEGFDEESLLEHERVTKVKNIQYVQLGKYIMECWYFSPFPKEYYPNGFTEYLYFCEFSLRFFKTKEELIRYQQKSLSSGITFNRHPPGNEIYRDSNISMFEIDGAVEKIYSQNLCYFAKLFLDHKTLYWDVDPFLFYLLCTRDERGFHPVGYFSKEK
jgi:hypothetical protein